jgi:hypothetical protein
MRIATRLLRFGHFKTRWRSVAPFLNFFEKVIDSKSNAATLTRAEGLALDHLLLMYSALKC